MNLKRFYNKSVVITSRKGKKFSGIVTEYLYPEDNESGKDSIVIDSVNGPLIEFYKEDIASINILEK